MGRAFGSQRRSPLVKGKKEELDLGEKVGESGLGRKRLRTYKVTESLGQGAIPKQGYSLDKHGTEQGNSLALAPLMLSH